MVAAEQPLNPIYLKSRCRSWRIYGVKGAEIRGKVEMEGCPVETELLYIDPELINKGETIEKAAARIHCTNCSVCGLPPEPCDFGFALEKD